MIELTGKYNTAKIFTDDQSIWNSAVPQIQHLLDQPFVAGSIIRVMPDCHAGIACTVGMTMTITDKVVPNFVGVDIGCGVHVALIQDKRIDFNQIDKAAHQEIPSGFNTRLTPHHFNDDIDLTTLRCAKHVDIHRAIHSIGTLGGGNHFIEIGQDDDGQLYLIVHSGSRNLGKTVCEHYQNVAANVLKRTGQGADRVLAYLEGAHLDDYLFDMGIVQRYADLNRKAIVRDLSKKVKFKVKDEFATVHNYIDLGAKILRKGAVSAQDGEQILVPVHAVLRGTSGTIEASFYATFAINSTFKSKPFFRRAPRTHAFRYLQSGLNARRIPLLRFDSSVSSSNPIGKNECLFSSVE